MFNLHTIEHNVVAIFIHLLRPFIYSGAIHVQPLKKFNVGLHQM